MRYLTLALFAALALGGCSKAKDQPEPQDSVATAPDAAPGLSVSDGRLVLPAVAGNPAAAYFTLVNGGRATVALAAVSIDGAQAAEMHRTSGGSMGRVDRLESAPGTRVAFAPGGLHVMVFKLKDELKPGAKVEMTLTFEGGYKLSAPLTAQTAGASAMGDMH